MTGSPNTRVRNKKTALMVQGTTSDAGKSTLVAALCRIFKNDDIPVAPFKPQNMALNSAVTSDGGEIGRAQAVQAAACKLDAHTDMNPILIKPSSDTGAQIIVQGKALTSMDAQSFHRYKPIAQAAVIESFDRLQENYECIVVEGAGSPAEINLRHGDIANMGFAESVDCPVIIIADIDKGGVFAHLVGTLDLLSEPEQNRVIGFVINKFRGDIALLEPGLKWLEEKTSKPVFGVLPYLHDFYLEAEDAIDTAQVQSDTDSVLKIVVPVLPRISNHTDFDALRQHPEVELTYVGTGQTPPPADLIILPGSKSVVDDLGWLREQGWEQYIKKHLRYGGKVIGICGGFQMLGEKILDSNQVESTHQDIQALSLLPITTEFIPNKALVQRIGELVLGDDLQRDYSHEYSQECENKSPAGKKDRIQTNRIRVKGYEIHHGKMKCSQKLKAGVLQYDNGDSDGVVSEDGQIFGSYLHGLFDHPEACNAVLSWAGLNGSAAVDIEQKQENEIERLAKMVKKNLDISLLNEAVNGFYETRNET